MKNYDEAHEYFSENHEEATEQENFVQICELAESYAAYAVDELNDEIKELKSDLADAENVPEPKLEDFDEEDIILHLQSNGYNVIKTDNLKQQMEFEALLFRIFPYENMRENLYLNI